MSQWKNVMTGFDAMNETINFGTRAFSCSDSGVYETTTLATISNDEKVPSRFVPKCTARYSELGIGISVGCSFHIFDKTCGKVLLSKNFEQPVECFDFVGNARHVVLSLEDSTLCYLNIKTGLEHRESVFSEFDSNTRICGLSSVPLGTTLNSCTFIIFLSCGKVYGVNFVPIEDECSCSFMEDSSLGNNSVRNNGITDYLLLLDTSFPRSIVSTVFLRFPEEVGYFESGPDSIKFFNLTGDSQDFAPRRLFNRTLSVQKIEVSQLGNLVICLTSEGTLLTLYNGIFSKHDIPVNCISDVVVAESQFGNTLMTSLLLTTTGEIPELILVDVHGFKISFRLKVSQNVFLVANQPNAEDFFFVEYVEDVLRLKSVTLINPDDRLKRLILRGRYEEAVALADLFDLNKEDIYKAAVESVASSLYVGRGFSEQEINLKFEEIIGTLALIKDDDFVVTFCLTCMVPDMVKTQKLYNFAADRVSSSRKDLLDLALSSQSFFGTFLLVNGTSATPDDWFRVRNFNPVKLVKDFIVEGNLKGAAVVCERHKRQILEEMTKFDALSFLEFPLKDNVSMKDLIAWLRNFTPIILSFRFGALPDWVNWIVKTARQFETISRENWPDYAVIFTDAALEAFQDFKARSRTYNSADGVYVDSFNPSAAPLSELSVLSWSLTQIKRVKKEYSIDIPYSYFSEASKNEEGVRILVLQLFEKIDECKLAALIVEFVVPTLCGSPNDLSDVIGSYVQVSFAPC